MILKDAVYFIDSDGPAVLMPHIDNECFVSDAIHLWAFTDGGVPIPLPDGRMCRRPKCKCMRQAPIDADSKKD